MLSNDFDTGITATVSNSQNGVVWQTQVTPVSTTLDIQTIIKEISEQHLQIVHKNLNSKEALVLGWYQLGKKALSLRDYWTSQHQAFHKNWRITFPDIDIRRVQQAIAIQVTSEEKIKKLAKMGFDNLYMFLMAIDKVDPNKINELLETTQIKKTIKNYDDPMEDGLHRLHCFCEFAKLSKIIDFDKVDIELLWDVILANKSIASQAIKAIQECIGNGNNVDDLLNIMIQTGGGDNKKEKKHSLPSINVINSMHINITEYYLENNMLPDDFDLDRLNQTKSNIDKLQFLTKEVDNAA
jgi:hypothetical protein